MTSHSLPAPRRRRYLWWIVATVVAVVIASVAGAYVRFGSTMKFAYGFVSANPAIRGCTTSFTREGMAGPVWHRVVAVDCVPALMSNGAPVPVSVRQRGNAGFEIVLEEPLADGRARLPIDLDQDGTIKSIQAFEDGRPTDYKSPGP